jgi:hypothetical protein
MLALGFLCLKPAAETLGVCFEVLVPARPGNCTIHNQDFALQPSTGPQQPRTTPDVSTVLRSKHRRGQKAAAQEDQLCGVQHNTDR